MSKVFSLGGGSGGGGIKLVSITHAITEPPEKVNYRPGQTFNPAGMVVTATLRTASTGRPSPRRHLHAGGRWRRAWRRDHQVRRGGVTAEATQAIGSQSVHPVPTKAGASPQQGAQSPSGRGATGK